MNNMKKKKSNKRAIQSRRACEGVGVSGEKE